jgi:hypothetical protein
MTVLMSNYPDNISNFNYHPSSPCYAGPDDEDDIDNEDKDDNEDENLEELEDV